MMQVTALVSFTAILCGAAGTPTSAPGPASAPVSAPAPAPAPLAAPAPGVAGELARLSIDYADHLFRDGDYYRSITEYRRYLYLTRGAGAESHRAALAIGEAYLRSRQLEAAAAQFESVAERTVDEEVRAVALLSAGRAHLLNERPLLAAARLAACRQLSSERAGVADEALFLLGWARLGQRDWDSARSAFAEVATAGGARAAAAAQAIEHLERRGNFQQKSPVIAGLLSLIPGVGHMYLGQWAVGFAALFWNALFVFATGYSIWTQEWGVAAVLGVFELSWFSGTMFGALNGAFRYNQDVVNNWLDDLTGELGAARELTPVYQARGLPGELDRLLPAAAAGG